MLKGYKQYGVKIVDDFVAEGWMKKESHGRNGVFQERYFVIDSKNLTVKYYVDEEKKSFKGEFKFTSQSGVQKASVTGTGASAPFMFFLSGSEASNQRGEVHNLYLSCASEENRLEWMDIVDRSVKGRGLSRFERAKEDIYDFVVEEEQQFCRFLNWIGFSIRRGIACMIPWCKDEYNDAKEAMIYEKDECIQGCSYCMSCCGVGGAVCCCFEEDSESLIAKEREFNKNIEKSKNLSKQIS